MTRTLRWIAGAIGILLVAGYLYANRTGRYQVAHTGAGFVVLDTATGFHWVYERQQDGATIMYPAVDWDRGVRLERRLVPPR